VVDNTGHQSVIYTTQNHPFWDETDQRWIDAGYQPPGHRLRGTKGRAVAVARVNNHAGHRWMDNLTVSNIHTYYVIAGNTPVLVHNCPADVPGAGASKVGPTSGSPNFGDGSISPGEGWNGEDREHRARQIEVHGTTQLPRKLFTRTLRTAILSVRTTTTEPLTGRSIGSIQTDGLNQSEYVTCRRWQACYRLCQ
jgi:hypothetical protein